MEDAQWEGVVERVIEPQADQQALMVAYVEAGEAAGLVEGYLLQQEQRAQAYLQGQRGIRSATWLQRLQYPYPRSLLAHRGTEQMALRVGLSQPQSARSPRAWRASSCSCPN